KAGGTEISVGLTDSALGRGLDLEQFGIEGDFQANTGLAEGRDTLAQYVREEQCDKAQRQDDGKQAKATEQAFAQVATCQTGPHALAALCRGDEGGVGHSYCSRKR